MSGSGLDNLGIVANVLGVADVSAKLLTSLAFYVRDVKNAHDDRARLMNEVLQSHLLCDRIKTLIDSPQGAALKSSKPLAAAIADCDAILRKLDDKLDPGDATPSRRGAAVLSALLWPFQRREVDGKIQQLESCRTRAESALQIDQTLSAAILNLDTKLVLSRLPIANTAIFNSQADEHKTTCLAGTSVQILGIITKWVLNPDGQPIFWLSGKAGTGKSTVSRSVANDLAAKDQLCGSFFFKRNEGSRSNLSKFFSTLAADLIIREPAVAQLVKEALDDDPQLFTKTTTYQFERLIFEPLSKASISRSPPTVIVIDALDECDSDENIVLLLGLLSRIQQIPNGPKIFITSRPELYLRMAFRRIHGTYEHATMEDTAGSEADMALFIQHELTRIRIDYNYTVEDERQISEDWPAANDVKQLSKAASPLFIFAATVCRLVGDRSDGPPDERLNYVLEYQRNVRHSFPHHIEQLASTYMPTLSKLLVKQAPSQQHSTLQGFKSLVGAIVTVATPLAKSTMADLLGIKKSIVDARLDLLHSVLEIPSIANLPVRVLHLSFSDFLINCKENNPFWIDEEETHNRLLHCCLRKMASLKQDMCDLNNPSASLSEVDPETLDRCLPPSMRYACLYWTHHFLKLKDFAICTNEIYAFLKEHLLHWIEALSLLGACADALGSIVNMRVLLTKSKKGDDFLHFLDDTEKCIRSNFRILRTRPLQVYSSLLVFAPKYSIIRNTFPDVIDQTLSFLPNSRDSWSGLVQSMRITSQQIDTIVFSSDLRFAAFPNQNTLSIRQLETGLDLHTLEINRKSDCKIYISPDCKLVGSESENGLLQIFSLDQGNYLSLVSNKPNRFYFAVFSPDSQLIAAASVAGCIDIWHLEAGRCIATLADAAIDPTFKWRRGELRIKKQSTLLFSPDSRSIVRASLAAGLKIWNIETGECTHLFQRLSTFTPQAAFSQSSALLAAVLQTSSSAEIWIWNALSHDCIRVIDLDQPGEEFPLLDRYFTQRVWFLSFLGDDELVSVVPGNKIWKWQITSGQRARILDSDDVPAGSVVLSPDLCHVAEWRGGHLRVRRIDSGLCISSFSSSFDEVSRIQFSSDSKQLVTVSLPTELSLWDLDAVVQTDSPSSAHTTKILDISLSPNSKLAVTMSSQYQPILWSCETGEMLGTIASDTLGGVVHRVFFSPDSSQLAVHQLGGGLYKGKLSLFEMECTDGEYNSATTLSTSLLDIDRSVFSHDSSRIAAFGFDGTATVWTTHSGTPLHYLDFDGRIWRAGLTSKLLAVARTSRLELWRFEPVERVRRVQIAGLDFHCIDFSPDSSLVAALRWNVLYVWQVATGHCIYSGSLNQLLRPPSPVAPRVLGILSDAGYIGSGGFVVPGSNLYTQLAASGEQRHGYGLTQKDDMWITWNGDKVLWVPPEVRMRRFHVSRAAIAMVSQLNTVIIIKFKEGKKGQWRKQALQSK
ncbi:hypothetical protein NLG97_g5890 [Lecanicillium saksenae]|uniref:Uncharacterized protein n=1 Tax=Lecanicillium saksenae TaxID=468837 RepID=A0ACC1QRQ3_9HYPO|nr:hypothetical protein NLG97_g5890 [Lecanicillium saksenae]